jgi:transcriptional regulator with XRE-family HTH domain
MAEKNLVPFVVAIGRNIKAAREMRGLSLMELAAKCELSKTALVNVESGETMPRQDSIVKIADALGVGPAELLRVDGGAGKFHSFDDREFLRSILNIFQFRLESNNFIRKDAETIDEFMSTRSEEQVDAWLASAFKRKAELRGYKFVRNQDILEVARQKFLALLEATGKLSHSPATGLLQEAELLFAEEAGLGKHQKSKKKKTSS